MKDHWLSAVATTVRRSARLTALLACMAGALGSAGPVEAGWWRIFKGAGDAGDLGKVGRLPDGFGALGDAAAHIKGVAAVGKGIPLAAHVTPEGHWKFANKQGEVYTAGSPEEMTRVTQMLAPEASSQTKLSLYLTDDTVFEGRAMLKDLPPDADLYLVDGKATYRLTRQAGGSGDTLFATVKPNLVVEASDRRLFSEAVFQLNRPLNKSNIRMLALQPGGPKSLSSAPGFDPRTKAALVDAIDPASIETAFGAVRGQSVVVTGRVEGGRLFAGDSELALDKLTRAAEAHDVNLIVLQSQATRQPGGQNWLWQTVEVAGYGDALKRSTFADFLNALGASGGELSVTAAPAGQGRITLKVLPTGDQAAPLSGQIGGWWAEAVSHVTGEVITKSVDVHARDEATQEEQDQRIFPWLPSIVHLLYFGLLIVGLLASPVTRDWWARIWPRESRADYSGALGYLAARVMRGLAYLLLFMPLAAYPALPVLFWRILKGWLMLPVRLFRWMFGRGTANAT